MRCTMPLSSDVSYIETFNIAMKQFNHMVSVRGNGSKNQIVNCTIDKKGATRPINNMGKHIIIDDAPDNLIENNIYKEP